MNLILQIKESIVSPPNEAASIFDLATTIVTHSQCSVTVPLCARIALLVTIHHLSFELHLIFILLQQKIYVESPDATFWDKVDACLLLIRTMAGGEAWKITKYVVKTPTCPTILIPCPRAFERILQTDCSTYGNNASYTLPDITCDIFQNSIDDVIGGTH